MLPWHGYTGEPSLHPTPKDVSFTCLTLYTCMGSSKWQHPHISQSFCSGKKKRKEKKGHLLLVRWQWKRLRKYIKIYTIIFVECWDCKILGLLSYWRQNVLIYIHVWKEKYFLLLLVNLINYPLTMIFITFAMCSHFYFSIHAPLSVLEVIHDCSFRLYNHTDIIILANKPVSNIM